MTDSFAKIIADLRSPELCIGPETVADRLSALGSEPVAWITPFSAQVVQHFREAAGAVQSVQVVLFSSGDDERVPVYASPPPAFGLVDALRSLLKDWENRADTMHPFATVCADELSAILKEHAP